jgi:hypothetical protein
MKPLAPYSHSLLSATAIFLTASLQAQTWETVFPNAASGDVAGVSGDIGIDAAGHVYAVGRYLATDGSSVAIVQGSGDGGATWELLDQYYEDGLNYSYHRAFGADPTIPGHVFAGGNLNNLLPNNTYEFDTLWIIRERDPVTGLWGTAEDYSHLAADVGEASCADIKVSPYSGDVYATGGGVGWIVRRRLADAPMFSAFSPVDTVLASSGTTTATAIAFDAAGQAIVAGAINGVWTVRQSSSGNPGSWATTESLVPTRRGEWGNGEAKAVAVSPSGTVHVAGTLWNKSTGKYHWVVRSSTNGGSSWSISDNLAPTGGTADAVGIAVASNNSVYVCGRVEYANGYHWVVRQGTPTTKLVKQGKKWVEVTTTAWSTIDDYQIVSGKNARANGIAVDAAGTVYVSGNGLVDDSGVSRFTVRKLVPTGF